MTSSRRRSESLAGIKSRAWTCTVHAGHVCDEQEPSAGAEQPPAAEGGDTPPPLYPIGLAVWSAWLDRLARAYDAGTVDYACISAELSKTGRPHLQGFVILNEEYEGKPSTLLSAHWLKARNLSGSRDYCAKAGIHIGKPDVAAAFEFGVWIDPGWNQTLRSRLIYEFTYRLKHGDTVGSIASKNPAGVLLVGLSNLQDVTSAARQARPTPPEQEFSPYYYIGRTDMRDYMESSLSLRGFAEAEPENPDESE